MGPQGSGKGTQAKILAEELRIPHISTGDILRNLIASELKQEVDSYINKGQLIPDELMIELLKQRISKPDCKNGFILDGFPRNIAQAGLLDNITKIHKVIEINISDELAIERVSSRLSCKKCGKVYNTVTNSPKKQNICDKCQTELYRRADDNLDAIRKRLKTYHKETKPIIKKYKSILISIKGNQKIDKIAKEIFNSIKEN